MTPKHKTKYSAGADLSANETVTIKPNQVELVGTGFFLSDLPAKTNEFLSAFNVVYVLCNRSSTAFKSKLIVANGVGVIDSDYKDEVKVMFMNLNSEPVTINKGDRIAQLIPMNYIYGVFDVIESDRVGGFGSTDK